MRSKLTALMLVVTFTFLVVVPGTAAPLTGPCVAGASYDPACDVNHDGVIDVLDIQLAAGRWNQSGVYTSDNDHDHLGQVWTGNNPLVIQGAFGSPDYVALLLSNSSGGGGGLHVSSATYGVVVSSAEQEGIVVLSAGDHGVEVGSAGRSGVRIGQASLDGIVVCRAGSATSCIEHPGNHGVEIGNAQHSGFLVSSAGTDGVRVVSSGWSGVHVGSAGDDGVHVANANDEGVYVGTVGGDGLYVHSAFYSGLVVNDAGNDGVFVREATNWAGRFIGDISVSGNCSGCRQANFAVNTGERALQPGDAVSVRAVTAASFDAEQVLWHVTPAQAGEAAIGVVAGRAELVTEPLDAEEGDPPAPPSQHLAPREGAAQPGEYLTVVYSGPMQVRVASNERAVAAGMRVTAAADGAVRPLATRTLDGMVVSEGAPVLGMTLEDPKDGLVWVLVNPQ